MLQAIHIGKFYNGFRLEDISLKIPKGYIVGVLGENGVGKTTLLNHILEPDISYQGRILIDGMDMKKQECLPGKDCFRVRWLPDARGLYSTEYLRFVPGIL